MKDRLIVKQGDQYSIPLIIKDRLSGRPIPLDEMSEVEVFLGNERYLYPGDITLEDEALLVPITQQQTFSLTAGWPIYIDVRVKYPSGDVVGLDTQIPVSIAAAKSKEVL